ncbi:MAG: cysteine desulfurase NifS, partial [Caldilineales bacterium]|nr:cysteine desulfurase NifS [Caldilineales bacterium]
MCIRDSDADALLLNLPEIMMGVGAACSSGALEPSHVLLAIGLSRSEASSTVRASLGLFTTADAISQAACVIAKAAKRLQRESLPL